MEQFLPIIIQAVAGGAGGGILGQILKSKGMGPLASIIAGAIGGIATGQGVNATGVLAQIAPMLGGETVATGITSLLGGGVLQTIAGLVIGKKAA